jgi:AraC-like DNA-binding protein
MTSFRFNSITPLPQLSPYVSKILVFESSGFLPALDKKLIVPNANFKLTYTHYNGIVAKVGGTTFAQNENGLTLSGLIDTPVNLNPLEDRKTRTIVIEFNPVGTYRLFNLSYIDIQNQIVSLEDLIGHTAKVLHAKLEDTDSLNLKVQLLQNFLIKELEKGISDSIYDYCIHRISDTKGLITVDQLEKETGYTARWINRKFNEHLGTGPKNLSAIVKFKQFYEAFSGGANKQILKDHIFNYYHDQSHFLRAFKRFTGSTPSELQNSINELAIRHYTS